MKIVILSIKHLPVEGASCTKFENKTITLSACSIK